LQRIAQLTLAPAEIVELATRALALRLLALLLAVAAGFSLGAFVAATALAAVRTILLRHAERRHEDARAELHGLAGRTYIEGVVLPVAGLLAPRLERLVEQLLLLRD